MMATRGVRARTAAPAARRAGAKARATKSRADAQARRDVKRAAATETKDAVAAGFQEMARPDAAGRFGRFGGKYVPETLIPALLELEEAYATLTKTKEYQDELASVLKDYVGRATPLYYAERLSDHLKVRTALPLPPPRPRPPTRTPRLD